jgi:MFS transporter, putative metabolite:H+ symporter
MDNSSDDCNFAGLIRGRLENLPISMWHAMVILICSSALLCDSADQFLIISIAPLLVREWGITSAQVGVIIAATGIGGMVGAPVFGALADRIGRRKCMALSIGIYSVLTGCAALSQNVTELLAIRALAGFGLGGVVPVTLAYVGEYSPAKWRGRVIAWWNSMFAFGIPLAGAVGLWVILPYGWRWGFLVGALPVVIISFVWWLPESVRYLVSHGKSDEALKTIERVEKAVLGREKAASVASEHRAASVSMLTAGTEIQGSQVRGWRAVKEMDARGMRGTMIASAALWLLPSMILLSSFFGVFLTQTKGMELKAAIALVTASSAFGPIGQFVGGFLSDWVGRKPTLVFALILVATMPLFTFLVAESQSVVFFCLVLTWIGTSGIYGTAFGYTTEQLPTELRAGGLGIFEGLRRLGGAIGPALVGLLYGAAGLTPVLWIAFTTCLFVVVVILVIGHETRGRPMVELVHPSRRLT